MPNISTVGFVKLVVVGDGAVGKTSLLMSYSINEFPEHYAPTIFDNYAVTLSIGSKKYTLQLFDTAGQEDFDRLRTLSYSQTDIFLVCFSVVNRDSFENVKYEWIPEIRKMCPNVPYILVGTKIDLRDDGKVVSQINTRKINPVTRAQGVERAKDLKAIKYMECSALSKVGLKAVFDEALMAVISNKRAKRSTCSIL